MRIPGLLGSTRGPIFTGAKADALAVGLTAIAIAVTWLTWPFLAGTPFFLLFGAVYLAARWGTRRASVLAVALGAVGSLWVFTPLGFPAWRAVGGFIVVGGVAALLASETNLVIQALQASEAQFRATWEHAAIGAALLNRDGKVVRINPALERILGHSSDEWIGRRFDRFTHSDDVRGHLGSVESVGLEIPT